MNRVALVPLGGEVRTWLVVFLDTDNPTRWWHRFMRPGYRHCLAFGFDGRSWIQVDCLFNLLDIRSYAEAEMSLVLEALAGYRARILVLERTVVSRPLLGLPVYCVSTVKHLLGLRCWALTPWQLYRALEKRGARRIDLTGETPHDDQGHYPLPRQLGA